MKKVGPGRTICVVILLFTFSSIGVVLLSAGYVRADSVSVAVSISDFIPIVSDIGQDHVQITGIMPAGSDPHGFAMTQAKMEEISGADIIVLASSNLLSFEENIKTNYPDKVYLDFPDYELEGATLDDFPGYPDNEHGYWLKANNSISIAGAFEKGLATFDPQNQEEYENNLDSFISRVETAMSVMERLSEDHGLKDKGVVATVPGVNYIIQNMGMNVEFVLLTEGSGFASGQALLEIEASLTKGESIAIVCPESMRNAKAGEVSEQISEDTGAPVIYVRFLSSENEESYIYQLYYNAAQFTSMGEREASGDSLSSLYLIAIVLVAVVALAEAYVIFRLRSRSWEMEAIVKERTSRKKETEEK
jgi:ABC-type Zn uptake system ZnuABC Zn-binding protein ZnuA